MIMKKIKLFALALCSAFALSVPQGGEAAAAAVKTYPGYNTTSRYITSLTYLPGYGTELAAETQRNLAANPALPVNEVVVLDFGKPVVNTQKVKKARVTTYGTLLFNNTTVASVKDIEASVERFVDAFESSMTGTGYTLTVAVGTSNYGSSVTKAHGQEWGRMINTINAYIKAKGYSSVKVIGASDIETAWNAAGVTRAWVDGYRSTTDSQLCDYGDAGGMPQASKGAAAYIPGSGSNGWTLEDMWYVSDGGTDASTGERYSFSLPEIYTPSGTQAAQWFNLALYSRLAKGQQLSIYGVMTDYAADPSMNSPESGWNQLAGYIGSSSVTSADLAEDTYFMQWSTDISWNLNRMRMTNLFIH